MCTVINFEAARARLRPAPFVDIVQEALALIQDGVKARRDAETARLDAVKAGHWTGSKHERGRDVAEVAKEIRKDIVLAIKCGTLPAGTKTSVRVSRYSMGQEIRIAVTAVPWIEVANEARVRQDKRSTSHAEPTEYLFSPEARAVLAKLEELGNAYNYDRSDSQTDYYQSEFHLAVDFACGMLDESRNRIESRILAEGAQ